MRERAAESGAGPIVNLSSGAGIAGGTCSGLYCATKFAEEGLSEALAQDVAPLGVRGRHRRTGPFRTDFLGRSIATAADEIAAYHDTAANRCHLRDTNDGKQAGDPDTGYAVILKRIGFCDPAEPDRPAKLRATSLPGPEGHDLSASSR